MPGPMPKIFDYGEVVSECAGCRRIFKSYKGKSICSYYVFPHTKWWFGEKCPQATYIKHKNKEDPIKEP